MPSKLTTKFLVSLHFIILFSLLAGCRQGTNTREESAVRYFETDNARIAYITYGKGEPIIMCMGYSGNMDLWDERLINLLQQNYQVIVFDYRGMGYSTNTDNNFTIKTHADDINQLCKHLKIEKANILGWSMGGYVAQTFALNYPEKVNKLVLYATDFGDTLAVLPSPEIGKILSDTTATPAQMIGTLIPKEWLNKHGSTLKTAFANVKEPVNNKTIKIQDENCSQWVSPNGGSVGKLYKLQMPTLIISGKKDVITPWQNALMLSDSIKNATLIGMDNGGHGLMFQYPTSMANYILAFLKGE